jgi:hypothetical protein
MKIASRSARAFVVWSDTAADRPHKEIEPPMEASPRLCRIVLVKPTFRSSSATLIATPSVSLVVQVARGARRKERRAWAFD